MTSQQHPSPQPSSELPHEKLPNELWLHIFSHILQTRPFLPSSQSGVLTVSWVCHRWRDLITSESMFWTTIHLFNNRVEIGKKQRQEKLVDLCLQRSNSHELDVILTDLQRYQHPVPNDLTLPLSFLNQAYRWRSLRLEIVINGTRTFERFSVLKGQLKRLQSCTIINKSKNYLFTTPITMSLDFLENAPQLHIFRFQMLLTQSLPTKVPFNKLTELDLVPEAKCLQHPSTIEIFLNILEHCPNLTLCRLFCNLADNVELGSRRVTHPNMLDLRILIHYKYPVYGRTIFDFLDFPSLTTLSITSLESWIICEIVHKSLDGFLTQSLLRLELHLPCQTNSMPTKHLKRLRLTPNLQHLFILIKDMGYSEDHIRDALMGDDGSFAWPPALHRLYYWSMVHNSTFAISSTPYWKYASGYLQRNKVIQEAST